MSVLIHQYQSSRHLQRRAHDLIPGGCHTYAKGDDQYPLLAPGFIVRGAGAHVWDIDGNSYIEYGMGNRAVGLGHAYAAVVDAAQRELANGCNFTRPAAIEVACAEQFLRMINGAEMVKFCKNGSDATSGAMRLARAYTGRDLIACCANHPFFSSDDWFIGTTAMNAGVPAVTRQLTLTFHYNDIESSKALFERYPGRIAAVILEAARTEDPSPDYLRKLQTLCCENGALLVLDEMITGFRWDNGGAQKRYGIVPDLSCFGKALANGFSVSALAGKREFMRLGGLHHTDKPRVFLLSTTHGAETHALAAAIANMQIYEREPVIERLEWQGRRLAQGFAEVISRHGLGDYVKVVGKPCCLSYATLRCIRKTIAVVAHAVSPGNDRSRHPDAIACGELFAWRRGYRPHRGGDRRGARCLQASARGWRGKIPLRPPVANCLSKIQSARRSCGGIRLRPPPWRGCQAARIEV